MRRRPPRPPRPPQQPLDDQEQAAVLAELEAAAARTARLTGATTIILLTAAACALYAGPGTRAARRWEFGRAAADGADAAAALSLGLAAAAAVRGSSKAGVGRVVVVGAALATAAQAAALFLTTPPVARRGWPAFAPLWAAAVAPTAGAGVALAVRAAGQASAEGLAALGAARYRFRNV
jgi:hypothetical protein